MPDIASLVKFVCLSAFLVLFVFLTDVAIAQSPENPLAPPKASLHWAPDRTCDLLNVAVDLDLDYANLTFTGHATNTMTPLRDSITAVPLHPWMAMEISRVTVDGAEAPYVRNKRDLTITTPPLPKGKTIKIRIDYKLSQEGMQRYVSDSGGWYWIPRDPKDPAHVGFWTTGEPNLNSTWCPTWDYPNDLATSETRTTVPADWTVIGNGILVSNKLSPDGKRRTFDWKMQIPHATYLLSLSGGPYDIKRDRWEGIPLWYAVPKGQGSLIDDNFSDTKEMLTYFSKLLGVRYPWPKYAQTATIDGPAGMENVSATTVGAYNLTSAREGYRRAAKVNSHEVAHQWFGDLVTCKDWGDIWLNESFATYLQALYFFHVRGKDAFEQELDISMMNYLAEARRVKHPLATKLYSAPDDMFGAHAYDKGALILHTLRRQLGDKAFFDGLRLYLSRWQHTPVESAQLCRCMTEATGIDCEPFWDQWIFKPGHPVLDYTWTTTPTGLSLTVKQLQDTSDGTPIYRIPATIGIIAPNGAVSRHPILLSKAEEVFTISTSGTAAAVLLDPDHDFLREIRPLHWSASELPTLLQYAPNCDDRARAMLLALQNRPTDATIQLIADQLRADKKQCPAYRAEWYAPVPVITQLAKLARPELRSLWLEFLDHPDYFRRAAAVDALAALPPDPTTITRLRAMITPKEATLAVISAINALQKWDKTANADVFQRALSIDSQNDAIRKAAQKALS